jgi:hypothetical protein
VIPQPVTPPGPFGAGVGRGRIRRRVARALRGPAAREHFGAWAWRAAAWAGGASAVVSAVVWSLLSAYGYRVPFAQLWLVFTAAVLLPWSLQMMHPPPEPVGRPDPAHLDLRDRPFGQADRWERRLLTTSEDPERFRPVVRDRLVPLAAERLRQRRGVSLRREPERARELLGGELHDLLTAPRPRVPGPYQLERFIDRLEAI